MCECLFRNSDYCTKNFQKKELLVKLHFIIIFNHPTSFQLSITLQLVFQSLIHWNEEGINKTLFRQKPHCHYVHIKTYKT